ncbi:MAG: DUF4105 domain-containing protein [Nitrospinales bacterium]
MNSQDQPNPERRKPYHLFLRLFIGVLTLPFTIWAGLAIYYSNISDAAIRNICSVAYVVIALSAIFCAKSYKRGFFIYAIFFLVVLIGWWRIPASNDRPWQSMSVVLCYADMNGDDITIHNIRNYDYRSKTDFTPQYYDKTINLTDLKTADLYLCFWGPTLIAHTMMSFGFEDQGNVCISIETRKEVGEKYSEVKGFLKQYELLYVVGDERDLVGLRTIYKDEDVYLYRLKAEPQVVRNVFLSYLKQVNRLNEEPKWYNALTHNCTTTIRGHTKAYTEDHPFDWRLLANGYLDEMLYEHGEVDTSLPLTEFNQKVYITDKAKQWDQKQDFSQFIRKGLPGIETDN